jgi:threonine dehydratase
MPMTLETLAETRRLVAKYVPTTPSYAWPLLARATGTELWVKHENHTPTGAFKVRGGVSFLSHLLAAGGRPVGLVSASRGNHSQSLAYAGRAFGVPVTIVVPEGNSPDKNAATEAFGAEVVVYGSDFQAAREYSVQLGEERGLVAVPPFHPWLVEGVATYAAELHEQVPGL